MKTYKLSLKDINPKLAKKVEETNKETKKEIKRLTEIERSKKVEELRRQGNTADMFKVMFGQK
jgi:hypothetical protein